VITSSNDFIAADNFLRETYDPEKIKKMWNIVVKNRRTDIISSPDIRDLVLNSWLRSMRYGITTTNVSEDRFLCKQKYIDHIAEYKHSLEFVKPFLYEFYESMGPSLYMINVYSREGYHILRIGKETAFSYANSLGIVEGLCFKEDVNGTCGFSLADILKKTIQIRGPEHYKEILHEIMGCYSPMYNEKGVYIGVISVTNAKKTPSSQALAMNFALSNAISFLFRNHGIMKSFESMAVNLRQYINNLPDALVIVNSDGIIVDVNYNFIDTIKSDNRDNVIGRNISHYTSFQPTETKDVVEHLRTTDGETIEMIISTSTFYTNKERGYLILMKKAERVKKNIYTYFNKENNTVMTGNDERYIKCLKLARNCSEHDIPVLIEGESGTGKENMARFIHDHSLVKHGPFVSVNCSAIPKELFESLFFGFAEGSFTNARKGGHIGKFEMANGGTLFLDEIGEMPMDLQAKLLRVVEDKHIEKVGTNERMKVSFRLIAATNKNLLSEVKKNNFRKDLYYRINIILIDLPPLRDRKADVEILVKHYADILLEKYKKKEIVFSSTLMDFFRKYRWPGNIREVRNILEYMVINNASEYVNLQMADLPVYITSGTSGSPNETVPAPTGMVNEIKELKSSEIEMIRRALEICSNKSEVARKLGISRDKLYRKMKELDIRPS